MAHYLWSAGPLAHRPAGAHAPLIWDGDSGSRTSIPVMWGIGGRLASGACKRSRGSLAPGSRGQSLPALTLTQKLTWGLRCPASALGNPCLGASLFGSAPASGSLPAASNVLRGHGGHDLASRWAAVSGGAGTAWSNYKRGPQQADDSALDKCGTIAQATGSAECTERRGRGVLRQACHPA